ncbi:MAG: alpha/beta hydrolase [Hoeflea sp.]|nr:alpha/beta hydrolase [Hoeflea sp.]
MTSYKTSHSWTRYRDLLQDRFGISLTREPLEAWRMIRGHRIHVDHWQPEGPSKGTVILVHGGGGNGRVLAPLADVAAGLGWTALAPDLPGYGLSEPAPRFRWDYDEWPAIVAQMADETAGPVVLLGGSVGGMTAALAAEASHNVSGVIATTLLDMGDPGVFRVAARWRWLGAASLIGFRLMPELVDRISFPLWLVAPMEAMSSDPAMQEYFRNDALLGRLWVSSRLFRTMHARKLAALAPGCPLLLVHPGADAWTPPELSRRAFERVSGPKEFVVLTNGSHLPLELPARDELRDHVRRFLAAV